MLLRVTYALLAVIGAIAPYSQFLMWLAENGPDHELFMTHLFHNRISTFFAYDVVISAVVVLVLIAADGPRKRVRYLWAPVVATLLAGVSCGLPLYLYLKETARLRRRQSRGF